MYEVPALDDLSNLIQFCSNDLRQILLTLQFLVQSSSTKTKYPPSNDNLTMTKPKWQSSGVFDAMYYSHLGEQWNESPLKVFFDDLTKNYTSKYNQSHLLLMNHSKNDTER